MLRPYEDTDTDMDTDTDSDSESVLLYVLRFTFHVSRFTRHVSHRHAVAACRLGLVQRVVGAREQDVQ